MKHVIRPGDTLNGVTVNAGDTVEVSEQRGLLAVRKQGGDTFYLPPGYERTPEQVRGKFIKLWPNFKPVTGPGLFLEYRYKFTEI